MKPEEAIKMLKYNSNVIHKTINGETDINEVEALDMAIEALSASKTERKTGTWQRKYSRPGVYADLCWHCSICGGKFSDTYANMWKYCPDCGSYNGGNNDNS